MAHYLDRRNPCEASELDLSAEQIDRACGVLLGSAVGDALAESTGEPAAAKMMALPIARAAAEGKDLRTRATQRQVVAQWKNQTEHVVACAAPLAIAYLDDEPRLIEAATAVVALAGGDNATAQVCVGWSLMIRHTVLTGEIAPSVGLSQFTDPDLGLHWMKVFDSLLASKSASFVDLCTPTTGVHSTLVGGLAGAWRGASSMQAEVDRGLRGRPGMRPDDLIELTLRMLGLDRRDALTLESTHS